MSQGQGGGRQQSPETRAILALLREYPGGIKAKELRLVARERGIKPNVVDMHHWLYRVLREAEGRGEAVWVRHGYWRPKQKEAAA